MSYPILLRWEYVYFLFNRTTLQVFVTYLTGALYVHPLWFYKRQHDNRVRSKLSVACQQWWFQWRLWFVNYAPSGEMHNYCTPHIIKENFENFWSIGATTYSYLKCIVYDKWLEPRQSFRITLYFKQFWSINSLLFYRCTVHFHICTVHSQTNALFLN